MICVVSVSGLLVVSDWLLIVVILVFGCKVW